MIHVVPPQKAPDFIRVSPLANEAGWVEVDQATLRHTKYGDIYGLGDVISAPNAKTAAAARKQAPVVAENLLRDLGLIAETREAIYDGYGSCPLTVERGKVDPRRVRLWRPPRAELPEVVHRRPEAVENGLAPQGEDPAADLLAGDAEGPRAARQARAQDAREDRLSRPSCAGRAAGPALLPMTCP